MTYTPRTGTGKLATALCETAKRMITAELEALRGNRSAAARRLGISRRALIYKMEKLGINIPATHGQGYNATKRVVVAEMARLEQPLNTWHEVSFDDVQRLSQP